MSNKMMSPGGPGWNDPPALSYETHTQTTSRRNILTKRVGLPDLKLPESMPSPNASHPGEKLPPPSVIKGTPPPPPKSCKATVFHNNLSPSEKRKHGKDLTIFNPSLNIYDPNSVVAKNESQIDCIKIFTPAAEDQEKDNSDTHKTDTNNSEVKVDLNAMDINIGAELKNLTEVCENEKIFSSQVKDSILKKINVLEQQIEQEKLPEAVFRKVEILTKYIVLKKYDDAWNTHLALVCDHASSVMLWISGVKKLISEAKKLK